MYVLITVPFLNHFTGCQLGVVNYASIFVGIISSRNSDHAGIISQITSILRVELQVELYGWV